MLLIQKRSDMRHAVSYTHLYEMFGICVAVTVIGAIAQFGAALRDNPKSAIKSLIGLVLFVVTKWKPSSKLKRM